MTSPKLRLGALGAAIIGLFVMLALVELLLRLTTPYPVNSESNKKSHPELGYVLADHIRGIDANGFRNPERSLSDAEILAIGDSHTYGYNVFADDSYPAILDEVTNRSVYNFGVAGYGIYQYKVLLDQALNENADVAVLSVFVANDFRGGCELLRLDYWQMQLAKNNLDARACDEQEESKEPESGIAWLKSHYATLQALELLADLIGLQLPGSTSSTELDPRDDRRGSGERRLEKIYRSVSLEVPEVQQSLAHFKWFISESDPAMNAAGKRLVVALIPSRPQVVYAWNIENGRATGKFFAAGAQLHNALSEQLVNFFRQEGISYLDTLPEVVKAYDDTKRQGGQFYRGSHPLRRGYEAYALAVANYLQTHGGAEHIGN